MALSRILTIILSERFLVIPEFFTTDMTITFIVIPYENTPHARTFENCSTVIQEAPYIDVPTVLNGI